VPPFGILEFPARLRGTGLEDFEDFVFGGSNKKVEIWGFSRPFLIFSFRFGKGCYRRKVSGLKMSGSSWGKCCKVIDDMSP